MQLRKIPKKIPAAVIMIIMLTITLTQNVRAQGIDHWVPGALVAACETLEISESVKSAKDLLQVFISNEKLQIADTKSILITDLFSVIIKSNLSSEKCLKAALFAQEKIRKQQFKKDLSNCIPYADFLGELDDRKGNFSGRWFCDTSDYGDWLKFHLWKSGKNYEQNAPIVKHPIFDLGPVFDVSELTWPNGPRKTDKFESCMKKANNGSAAERRRCVVAETQRHDISLNTAYACLQKKLSKNDFDALRKSQRAWIKQKNAACAFTEETGSIVHDLRSSCHMEETVSKSFELAYNARKLGCEVTIPSLVAHDLNVWRNNDGNGSISNEFGLRLEISCNQGALARLTSLDDSYILKNMFSITDNTDLFFYSSNGELIKYADTPASYDGEHIAFNIHSEILTLIRKSASMAIESDPFGTRFSLQGSALALEGCVATEKKLPPPNISLPEYVQSQEGIYVDIEGDFPLRIRCDTSSPEIYMGNQGFFASLFGSKFSPDVFWSLELFYKTKSVGKVLRKGQALSDGVGVKLDLEWLYKSRGADRLVLTGGGYIQPIPLSSYRKQLSSCAFSNYKTLERFLIGEWDRIELTRNKTKIYIAENYVDTFLGDGNFAGWPPVKPRAFYWELNGKRSELMYWMLSPSGNFHVNHNTYICKVDPNGTGALSLDHNFDCQFFGLWSRQ